ncbi:hypothetical protein PISL3812_05389 [Talaromyces islandicus]|uniref:Uncharacterized protein n=1 Tax=Talaromyces islandicus TaxID=28573 RepID=A0A0U1LYE3_TALIS|nr:hypothetical protein PISL3812_05389 [Talaromyces islandicus]
MLITFYRPWATESPDGLDIAAKEDWQYQMRTKGDAAATRTNEILDALVQHKLLGLVGPMTPPLLVPAMKMHLLQCKSRDSLSKRMGLNKLEMCMLAMEEFQKTYTVASIYRAIFMKAIQQIFPDYKDPMAFHSSAVDDASVPDTRNVPENSRREEISHPNIEAPGGEINVLDEAYFMHDLIDDGSLFSFWETWNQA